MNGQERDRRPVKRLKSDGHGRASTSREALFTPFRSLGHVSTRVPFVYQSQSSKYLETPALTVVTSLGNSWAMWDGKTLRLLFVGPDTGSPITSLAMAPDSVFAAAGQYIGRYVRGKEVGRFVLSDRRRSRRASSSSSTSTSTSSDDSSDTSDSEDSENEGMPDSESNMTLQHLTLFGSTLVALASDGSKMFVWDIPKLADAKRAPAHDAELPDPQTPYATLRFPTGFIATCVVHPASYLNKVVVGSQSGELAVWNTRTGTLLHTFASDEISTTPSAINCMSQSPAIDVLGLGLADGSCVLFDVRMGEALGRVRLETDAGITSSQATEAVTGVSFRDDAQAQILAVASSSGHIAIFDLANKLRLLHVLRQAHEDRIAGMEWVAGQPLIMSNAGDNTLKQWVFDDPASPPRLLRQRSGHSLPPNHVRYYGDDGKAMLTTGKDRALRYLSVVRDSRGHELSQGSIEKKAHAREVSMASLKFPMIKSMSYSTNRSRDWDDVLTVSEGEKHARTWSVQNKRLGKWTLKSDSIATACTVTACGNYGLVGSDKGIINCFNMQSGIKRKVFKIDASVSDPKAKTVSGIATDALNRVVIVSTLRGELHFFDFQTMKLVLRVTLPASITSIQLQRDNGLLACVCDDLTVRLVDIETRRIVREFKGFEGDVIDLDVSRDSRWLLVCSSDSVIRTFDIPTGGLIDAFRCSATPTSLAFSPTADFLATTHVGSLGVHLWVNRAQFSDVTLRSLKAHEIREEGLPTARGDDDDEELGHLEGLKAPTNWDDVHPYTTPDQLAGELLTLSLMPRARWQTILNLETIKARNKPTEPPKAPERAPFFLPTVAATGGSMRFDLAADANDDGKKNKKGKGKDARKLDFDAMSIETEFMRKLKAEPQDGPYNEFFEYLKALSPSAVSVEIRSLTLLPDLVAFLHALKQRLASHRDYEAVQTYLAVFLRIHGDVLAQNGPECKDALMAVKAAQEKEATRLSELVGQTTGTLAFLRGVPIA